MNTYAFFPGWLATLGRERLSLHRLVTGSTIELSGPDLVGATDLLRAARRPGSPQPLAVGPRSGKKHAALLALLARHEVLRPLHAVGQRRVVGNGRLAKTLRTLTSQGGWDLPPLIAGTGAADRTAVEIGACDGGLIAVRSGASPCAMCVRLRLLARRREDKLQQSPYLHRGAASARHELALLAEVLLALQKTPLRVGEGLAAHAQQGLTRGPVLAHPDCPACGARVRLPQTEVAAALRRRHPRAPASVVRQRLTDPTFGPLEIIEETKRARYPLRIPFIWGSVFLTRWMKGDAVGSSTYGGIYASTPSVRHTRLLALSEGVERLSARSIGPSTWGNASALGGVPVRSIYAGSPPEAEHRRRAFCEAFDLVARRPRLVPFESVVVGLGRGAYREAAYREPFYSGAASHLTLMDATLHATVELLKRDAFMISWYRRRALPRLTWPKRLSAVASGRLAYLKRHGIEVELFNLTLDVPLPTLLLRLTAKRSHGSWPAGGAMLVPSGALQPMAALEDGLRLACSQFVSIALHPSPDKDPFDPAAVRRLGKRAAFWPLLARYLNPKHSAAHAFLGGAGPERFEALPHHAEGDSAGQAKLFRHWLRERSLPWLVVRLTDRWGFEAGFEVAKVIIPGLVGIAPSRATVNLQADCMSHLWSHATCAGLNPDPHPLY